jgi:hypothetical protein
MISLTNALSCVIDFEGASCAISFHVVGSRMQAGNDETETFNANSQINELFQKKWHSDVRIASWVTTHRERCICMTLPHSILVLVR